MFREWGSEEDTYIVLKYALYDREYMNANIDYQMSEYNYWLSNYK